MTLKEEASYTFSSESCPHQPWRGDLTELSPKEKALGRFSLEGKTCVVTGGARGLGLDAAYAVLEHGVKTIFLLDWNPVNLENAVNILKNLYPDREIYSKTVDVTLEQQVIDSATYVRTKLEDKPLDILLVFAGIAFLKKAEDHTLNDWNNVMNINSTGTFLATKHFGQIMIDKGTGGSIILTGSISGHAAHFPQPQIAYHASKGAVILMKNSFAAEWACHNIRVNSISPGYMDTALNEGDRMKYQRDTWVKRTPMNRMGARGELNGAVILLASDAGTFITGSDILVDGGISCVY
jgi:sorbose reductase